MPERQTRPPSEAGPGLSPVVPILAGLGLAILCFCTLPAARAQRRLAEDHARLLEATRAAEQRVRRLREEVRRGSEEPYLRTKATRDLLHRGRGYLEARDRRLRTRGADGR